MDAWSGSHPPTKTLPFHGDMTEGRLCHVPAFFRHSTEPSSEPQTQRFYFFTVATICIFAETLSPIIYFFRLFRRNHVADVFFDYSGNHRRNLFHRCHYFCIINMMLLFKLWEPGLTPFDNIGCSTSFSRSTTRGSTVSLMV